MGLSGPLIVAGFVVGVGSWLLFVLCSLFVDVCDSWSLCALPFAVGWGRRI